MSSRLLSSLTRRMNTMSLVGQHSTKSTHTFGTVSRSQPIMTVATNKCWMAAGTPSSSLLSIGTPLLGHDTSASSAIDRPFFQPNRTMVTRKKRLARREKRRLEAKAAARKGEDKDVVKADEEKAAPQHSAWVDFQKSITVGDFQTGQLTTARVLKKGESGQQLRDMKRQEKLKMRLAAKRPEIADIRGGEYPVLRYSDEETERLLAQAYAAIPKRGGKRGTRNLRRQKRRWFLVKKIHAKAKHQRTVAHYRMMDKRSVRHKAAKEMQFHQAPRMKKADRNYQREVLQRWVENLRQNDEAELEVIQAEATVIEQDAKA